MRFFFKFGTMMIRKTNTTSFVVYRFFDSFQIFGTVFYNSLFCTRFPQFDVSDFLFSFFFVKVFECDVMVYQQTNSMNQQEEPSCPFVVFRKKKLRPSH